MLFSIFLVRAPAPVQSWQEAGKAQYGFKIPGAPAAETLRVRRRVLELQAPCRRIFPALLGYLNGFKWITVFSPSSSSSSKERQGHFCPQKRIGKAPHWERHPAPAVSICFITRRQFSNLLLFFPSNLYRILLLAADILRMFVFVNGPDPSDPAFISTAAADQAPPPLTLSRDASYPFSRAMSNHKNQKPPQKLRRNERERKRVHQVGFPPVFL